MNKPDMILLCGLPGSGKSTFANENLAGYKIHSSDELRIELFGDVKCQDKNGELFNELHKRIIRDLKDGHDVVYDATNINYKTRMGFLKNIKNIDANKICFLFATPYAKTLEFSTFRERVVPQEAVKNMYKNFTIPQHYEGWNDIRIIWNYDMEDFDIIDLLDRLDDVDHGTPHHTLTLGKHMDKCFDILRSMTKKDRKDKLCVAAQIHDISKPFCCEYNASKKHFTYYNHQFVSAYDALFYLKSSYYKDEEILEICNYIQHHMRLFSLETDKAKKKFIDLVGQKVFDDLVLLHQADILAK